MRIAKKGRSATEKMAERVKAKVGSAKLPGYGYWPLSKAQQALEETAKKAWKKRPVRAPIVAETKRKREDWAVNLALPLGPKVFVAYHRSLNSTVRLICCCFCDFYVF